MKSKPYERIEMKDLNELYDILADLHALPKTLNPIKLVQRKLLREEIYRRIHAELDRRIASRV
jgi:hypothetical protein